MASTGATTGRLQEIRCYDSCNSYNSYDSYDSYNSYDSQNSYDSYDSYGYERYNKTIGIFIVSSYGYQPRWI